MLFVQKFIVLKHERGLLFREGDFIRFLEPGTYRFRGLRRRHELERFDLAEPLFAHRLVDYLVEAERADVERLFTLVETGANEVAVVYQNQRVVEIVGPAQRKLYWKGPVETRVDRFDLDAKLVRQLAALSPLRGLGQYGVYSREVPDGHVGLLYVDGKLSGSLAPGVHAFWTYGPGVKVDVVDLRVKTLDVQGQEILTRDKVSLRVNLTATYRFVDVEKAVRAAVGTRALDALLEDKSVIDSIVAERVGERFADIGIAVESVGVKDIILPGDMKNLLGKVVEAEKAAQANVIRRREETNATRSLLNTAKVMESNGAATEGTGDAGKGHRECRQPVGLRRPGRRAERAGSSEAVRLRCMGERAVCRPLL